MRLGLRGRKLPRPDRAGGYVLITLGAVIMLLSMPLSFYAAALGALIAYVGYSMRGR